MMTAPAAEGKVSIVIPCFNHGAMLREALASLEEVRNENLLEVIIVDDGSSDAETIRILRSEEHTSELQSQSNLVCRLLLEKKKNKTCNIKIVITPIYDAHVSPMLSW